jgi:hypothetical protein
LASIVDIYEDNNGVADNAFNATDAITISASALPRKFVCAVLVNDTSNVNINSITISSSPAINLNLVDSDTVSSGDDPKIFWYQLNEDELPSDGDHDIDIALSTTADDVQVWAATITDADDTIDPIFFSNTENTSDTSMSVTGVDIPLDSVVLDAIIVEDDSTSFSHDDGGFTEHIDKLLNNGRCAVASDTLVTTQANKTQAWTLGSSVQGKVQAILVVPINDNNRPKEYDKLIDTVDSSNTETFSHSFSNTGDDLVGLLRITAEDSSTTDIVVSSATYDGESLTLIPSAAVTSDVSGTVVRSEIWYIKQADLPTTSGTYDLVVTFTGTVN